MAYCEQHNAHAQPPDALRALFKKWQRSTVQDVTRSPEILDMQLSNGLERVTKVDVFSGREAEIQHAIYDFVVPGPSRKELTGEILPTVRLLGFEVNALPGAPERYEKVVRQCLIDGRSLPLPRLAVLLRAVDAAG